MTDTLRDAEPIQPALPDDWSLERLRRALNLARWEERQRLLDVAQRTLLPADFDELCSELGRAWL